VRSHNSRSVLARAVASVQRQTYPDWELIIVDDASGDGTIDWIHATYAGEPRMRLIAGNRRSGAAAAANAGIARARGRHVALLDSDDEWEPGFLATASNALSGAPDAIAAYTDHTQVWDDWALERVVRAGDPQDQRRDMLVAPFIPCLSQLLFRRDALVALGPLDDRLRVVSDRDLLLRAALRHVRPFVHAEGALVRRHFHGRNLMNNIGRVVAEGRTVAHRAFTDEAAQSYEALRERAFAGIGARADAYGRQRAALAQPASPLISVLIVAHSQADLMRAVAAVDAQAYSNRELVVVDDGGSAEIGDWVAAVDRSDLQFVPGEGRGTAAGYNEALAASRGELLTFAPTEEAWQPGYLSAVAAAFSLAPPPVFSYADPRRPAASLGSRNLAPIADTLLAMRRDMVATVGGFDTAADDAATDLCRRLLAHQFRQGVVAEESNSPVSIARLPVPQGDQPDVAFAPQPAEDHS
jgi:glycosyltransferase involved in cell wall biosynthesis